MVVTSALLDILDGMPVNWRPSVIQCDNGSEMQNFMKQSLSEHGIKLFHSQAFNPRSNGAVERLNKTVKQTLFALMARVDNKRWIDFLPPLVENLNDTKHGTTGFKPIDLMNTNLDIGTIDLIQERMRKRVRRPEGTVEAFYVGDYVRVALTSESAIRKLTFRKRIMNNWSSVIFQVYSVSAPGHLSAQPQYLLKNMTTNRKSKKLYWSYQMRSSNPPGEAESSSSEEEVAVPVRPPAAPVQPRAMYRVRASL